MQQERMIRVTRNRFKEQEEDEIESMQTKWPF